MNGSDKGTGTVDPWSWSDVMNCLKARGWHQFFLKIFEEADEKKSKSVHTELWMGLIGLSIGQPRPAQNVLAWSPLGVSGLAWHQKDFVPSWGVERALFFLTPKKDAWMPLQDLQLSLNCCDCLKSLEFDCQNLDE